MNKLIAILMAAYFLPVRISAVEVVQTLDYAGIEELLLSGDPFNGMGSRTSCKQSLEEFVDSPGENLTEASMLEIQNVAVKDFHYLLVYAEAFALVGEKTKADRYRQALRAMLEYQVLYNDIVGDGLSLINIPRAEYMLARIINDHRDKCVKLTADDVRSTIPSVMGCIDKFDGKRHLLSDMETFRKMLIVGAAIETYLRDQGHLPENIDELRSLQPSELVDCEGLEIRYSKTGSKDWKLFSGGVAGIDDNSIGDEIVPGFNKVVGRKNRGVWFSSKFSDKRKALIKNGKIQEDSLLFKCSYTNGLIRLGR